MKNILGLLIIIGLLAVAWVNRERLAQAFGRQTVVEETPEPEPEPVPTRAPITFATPTPHPAKEAQARAKQLYPGIGVPNSPMNKKFVAFYNEAAQNTPSLFAQEDWPLVLAEKAMVAMGGVPLPRNTPPPVKVKPLPGTMMDERPGSKPPK